jgi:hypothetical protein
MSKRVKISKAELHDSYVFFRKTLKEIADEYNTSVENIIRLLNYHEIKIRDEDKNIQSTPIIYEKKSIKNPINFQRVINNLSQYNIKYIARHHNTVLPHSSTETWKHWMAKCILFKLLRDKRHEVFTELHINNAETDVFDLTQCICYELESIPGSKTFQEKMKKLNNNNLTLIIIDLRKVPDDYDSMKEYFKENYV